MKKLILIVLALFIGLVLFIDNSFFSSPMRKIASVENDVNQTEEKTQLDLSDLSEAEFSKAFKYSLVNPMQLIQTQNHFSVRVGNFLIQNEDGQKIFACSKYETIEFIYEADGMAFSGDIPRMKISGPCLNSEDFNYIQELPVDNSYIQNSPFSSNHFEFKLNDSNSLIQVDFQNVVELWPTEWNLIGIRLVSAASKTLELNGYEIIAIKGQPFSVKW